MPQAPNLFSTPSSSTSATKPADPVAAARAKLAAAQAAAQASKQRDAAPLKAKVRKVPAPAVVAEAEEDDEFIDDHEGEDNGLEATDEPADDGEDQENESDEPTEAASPEEPKRRGRGRPAGKSDDKAMLDPVALALVEQIKSQAARKVVRVVAVRMFPGLRGRQAAVSAAAPSRERDTMLEALSGIEAAFENLATIAATIRQDWTLRRAPTPRAKPTPPWQPIPGTLVYLNPAYADAFGDFMDPDLPAKVVKILPGNTALVLSSGTKVPVPFAVLMPDEG